MHMKIRRTAKSKDTALILHTDFFSTMILYKGKQNFLLFFSLGITVGVAEDHLKRILFRKEREKRSKVGKGKQGRK